MPVDPRGDLPIRIARACSDELGLKITPSALYAHDGGTHGTWHSQALGQAFIDQKVQTGFENRRITCFNLECEPPPTQEGLPELQSAFSGDAKKKSIIARIAIHEVHFGYGNEHNFEGQTNPKFPVEDTHWQKKVGIEITFNTADPTILVRNDNGNVSVFPDPKGTASKFAPNQIHYNPAIDGAGLVDFIKSIVLHYCAYHLPESIAADLGIDLSK